MIKPPLINICSISKISCFLLFVCLLRFTGAFSMTLFSTSVTEVGLGPLGVLRCVGASFGRHPVQYHLWKWGFGRFKFHHHRHTVGMKRVHTLALSSSPIYTVYSNNNEHHQYCWGRRRCGIHAAPLAPSLHHMEIQRHRWGLDSHVYPPTHRVFYMDLVWLSAQCVAHHCRRCHHLSGVRAHSMGMRPIQV